MNRYAFGPLRDNERYIRIHEREHTIHYEINPTKIMFKGYRLSDLSDWGKRKFETLLVLNTPQKHVTMSLNDEIGI